MPDDEPTISEPERWVDWEPNLPYVVDRRVGIYRYRYHYRDSLGQVRICLFGGKPPAHAIDASPEDLTPVPQSEMAMVRHASMRKEVILDKTQPVTLLAWDVLRSKAKVIKASGAVLTVSKDRLQLPQGESE